MESHHLRSILLNLHYRLSDHDRERLHFYLKNDVPRSISDDSTLSGTLRLMQSLFDQERITENDFTLLIDAFKQIRCFDAVNLLREHQRRMQLSGFHQSLQTLASIMPSTRVEQFLNDCDDDEDSPNILTLRETNHNNNENNNDHLSDNNNIDVNPIDLNINEETESRLSSRPQRSCTVSFTKQYFIFALLPFVLALSTLIIVVIQGMNRIHSLEATLQMRQNLITRTQDQNNQTLRQSINLLSEKNTEIEHLNKTLFESNYINLETVNRLNNLIMEKEEVIARLKKTLTELNQEHNQTKKQLTSLLVEKDRAIEELNKTLVESDKKRKTDLIKAGRKFGGNGGGNFDDSSSSMFTTAHYLSGIIYSDLNDLIGCQFIYTSSHDNQSRIESRTYGDNGATLNSTYQYYLDDNERIDEVVIKSADRNFISMNKIVFTTKLVIRLKFVTTKGRIIPPNADYMDGEGESERFPGYILGYATGMVGIRIDQLQFFWYRTKK